MRRRTPYLTLGGLTLGGLTLGGLTIAGLLLTATTPAMAATLTAVVFTIAFILFEMIGRLLVESAGLHEFWVMLLAYFGFLGLIGWRARATAN